MSEMSSPEPTAADVVAAALAAAGDTAEPADPPTAQQAPPEPTWQRFDLATQAREGLQAAEEALAAGQLVVLPTDTVYGIGADAFNPAAVQELLDAKNRGRDMPPPVLIAEPAMLRALVATVPPEVAALIDRFWPGALTLIMKAQASLRIDLGRTQGTIAVRVPDHDGARALLRRVGPLAVSSANVSGQPAATSVEQAIAQLGNSVAVYLDAGPTPGPVASTIIDLASTPDGRIVRAGALTHADLSQVLTALADLPAPEPEPEAGTEPEPEATSAPEPETTSETAEHGDADTDA